MDITAVSTEKIGTTHHALSLLCLKWTDPTTMALFYKRRQICIHKQ
jgi:hypothetical protein